MKFHKYADIFPLKENTEYTGIFDNGNIITIIPHQELKDYYFINFFAHGGWYSGFSKPVRKDFVKEIIARLEYNSEEYKWSSIESNGWIRNPYMEHNIRRKPELFIYFIYAKELNMVKIGLSEFPEYRLENIQPMSPAKLEILKIILGDLKLEHELHGEFKHLHSHGEWFHYDDDIKNYLR